MVASSRSRSEMLVLDSVKTTANANAAAMTVTTYTTTSMILKLSEKSLAILVELDTLTNVFPAESSSARAIFSASVPSRLTRNALGMHGSPKASW